MLGILHPEDVPRFVRKVRRESDEQCFHTCRELILGAHPERIFARLRDKASVYALTAAKLHVPYVVALFGEFTAPIEPFEVRHVLHELHGGVFGATPAMAGTIFFRERHGRYEYHHLANSQAIHSSQIIRACGGSAERPNTAMEPTARD